jgi:glycosyltransferase involved in cell wall biosynthesis
MKKISIGVPIYNEEKNIKKLLNNIVSQKYTNKEVIISDNCSLDSTGIICRRFSKKYKFIKYYRQQNKINLFSNFIFVLKKSRGEYFTWQAADDLKSKNFLKNNIYFLNRNLTYVASTGITKFNKGSSVNNIAFSFSGSLYSRIWIFIYYKWLLKGIFDAVIRTKIIKKFPYKNLSNYFAWDWTVVLYLILQGKINRDLNSYAIFGLKGISSQPNAIKLHFYNNKNILGYLFPFYYFSKNALYLIKNNIFFIKIYFLLFLITLNFIIYPRMFLRKVFSYYK